MTLRESIARAYRIVFHPEVPEDASKLKRWELRVEGPMLIVSMVFLILFAWSALGKSDQLWTQIAEVGLSIAWVAFIIDYVVRLSLAEQRKRWFWRHLHELLLVVLPMFRPLQILRIVPILFLLQRYSTQNRSVTVAIYTAVSSVLLVLVASLSIYDVEQGYPESQIANFGDALWWSIVTVTTVGYGDIAPVSAAGRFIAILLMLAGIAVAGVVTATIASWLIKQVEGEAEDKEDPVQAEIRALRQEVAELRKSLKDEQQD
ncbi:potassium channel family protein [Corynebacterium pseudopelargi]|uniref:pH-gated potassium channel KcsA n=1 Tax=Corynebacterium pseudopelargi TaxID=2080757 RepID=A0A3G6IRY4_9CORY|nr:potassium channel family protein [Corynebacterium pseudopelargi]AZA08351.1 pH-gated potassium channel KcsA [Corynebacterium pseudopelargi]